MTIFTPQSALDPGLIMKQVDAEFARLENKMGAGGGGSGGGSSSGVPEAPIDQNLYSRGQGTWVPTGALGVSQPIAPTGGGGISEAPTDGKLYGRENAAWIQVPAAVPGPAGPMGPASTVPGPAGPSGSAGTSMTAGAGAPTATMPVGTLYLDSVSGDLYQFS